MVPRKKTDVRTQCAFTLALLLLLCSQMFAADPFDEVRQLRERGEYDQALAMLRKLSRDMSLAKEFRAAVDYEQGVTLVEKARMLHDTMNRQGILSHAQAALQRFVSQHQTHRFASSARSQLGSVFIEKARLEVERSKNSATPEDREKDLNAAREYYDQAQRVFASNVEKTKTALEQFGPLDPTTEREKIEVRDRLRVEYLQSKLLIPAVKEEQAETFNELSDHRQKLLRSAAEDFAAIHETYRTRLAGLYALMYQGRCHVKLGEHDKALECFDSLFEQPDTPQVFTELKLKSALLAADCWLDPKRKNYERAIGVMQRMVDNSNADELRQPDRLLLRVKLARAYQLRANQLEEAKDRTADDHLLPEQLTSKALEHARAAARVPGEHVEQARAIVAEITKRSVAENSDTRDSDEAGATEDIKTFDEARRAGLEMLNRMRAAAAKSHKPAEDEACREAIRFFQLALKLVETDTPLEDLNATRYLLCYAFYTSGDYQKAGEMGEFVARRFPTSAGARPSAKIAVSAYLHQHRNADASGEKAAANRLAGICRYIIKTWPKDETAIDAAVTLVSLSARREMPDAAAQYLQAIPATSPRRGDAELTLGRSFWQRCLKELAKSEEPDEARTDAYVSWRSQARDLLQSGLARQRDAPVNAALAIATLSLCQVYVDEGGFAKAAALLEDKDIGPLTLVVTGHAAAQGALYDIETFKLATRAYRGIVESAETDEDVQKEAEEKLKSAIVELDKRRKAHEKAKGGTIDLELAPVDLDGEK